MPGMETIPVYLAAYDIRSPRRLRKALHVLRDYALGRQKSVFECPLKAHERDEMLARVKQVIEPESDRFALVRLDPRGKNIVLGKGLSLQDPSFFYVG